MTEPTFRLAPLGAEHARDSFCCGEEALDRYFKTQATQDIRRRIANCFVAVESATGLVAAYYTIAAASIPLVELPREEAKRLPRYPTLPAVRIGRLAVDQRFQGRGLGGALLITPLAGVRNPHQQCMRSWSTPKAIRLSLSISASVSAPSRASPERCFCRLLPRRRRCFTGSAEIRT